MKSAASAVVTKPVFEQSDWGLYAKCYDSLLQLTPYASMLREIATLSSKLPNECILDASCGTGNFEVMYAERGVNATRIVGIDTSLPMLKRAREKCGSFPNTTFQIADLDVGLPFDTGSFAQVVSLNTLYAVKNPEQTLREFYRVLAKDSFLVLVTPKVGYENGIILKKHCESTKPDEYWANVHESSEREERLIREALSDESVVREMLTIAAFNRNIADNRTFHFFDSQELCQLLKKVGFKVVRTGYAYANQDICIVAQKGV